MNDFEFVGQTSNAGASNPSSSQLDFGAEEIPGVSNASIGLPLMFRDHHQGPKVGVVKDAWVKDGKPMIYATIDPRSKEGLEAISGIVSGDVLGLSLRTTSSVNKDGDVERRKINEITLCENPAYKNARVTAYRVGTQVVNAIDPTTRPYEKREGTVYDPSTNSDGSYGVFSQMGPLEDLNNPCLANPAHKNSLTRSRAERTLTRPVQISSAPVDNAPRSVGSIHNPKNSKAIGRQILNTYPKGMQTLTSPQLPQHPLPTLPPTSTVPVVENAPVYSPTSLLVPGVSVLAGDKMQMDSYPPTPPAPQASLALSERLEAPPKGPPDSLLPKQNADSSSTPTENLPKTSGKKDRGSAKRKLDDIVPPIEELCSMSDSALLKLDLSGEDLIRVVQMRTIKQNEAQKESIRQEEIKRAAQEQVWKAFRDAMLGAQADFGSKFSVVESATGVIDSGDYGDYQPNFVRDVTDVVTTASNVLRRTTQELRKASSESDSVKKENSELSARLLHVRAKNKRYKEEKHLQEQNATQREYHRTRYDLLRRGGYPGDSSPPTRSDRASLESVNKIYSASAANVQRRAHDKEEAAPPVQTTAFQEPPTQYPKTALEPPISRFESYRREMIGESQDIDRSRDIYSTSIPASREHGASGSSSNRFMDIFKHELRSLGK